MTVQQSSDGATPFAWIDGPYETSAKDFFEEVIQRSYTVREEGLLGHRMVYNWPDVAFAELLTNAVLHIEYDKKQYVGVYVYQNTQEEFRDRNYLNPEITRMFHALGLKESYGSGIRRAKHAMAHNGNPAPLFEPTNDVDDYTMVTYPINGRAEMAGHGYHAQLADP